MEMIHELSRWKNQEKIRVSFFLRLNTFIFFLQLFHHDNVMMKLFFLCTDEIWSKHLSIDFLKRKKIHFRDNRKWWFWVVTVLFCCNKERNQCYSDSFLLFLACSVILIGIGEAVEWAGELDLTRKMLRNDGKTDPRQMSCFITNFLMLLRSLRAQNSLKKSIFVFVFDQMSSVGFL